MNELVHQIEQNQKSLKMQQHLNLNRHLQDEENLKKWKDVVNAAYEKEEDIESACDDLIQENGWYEAKEEWIEEEEEEA